MSYFDRSVLIADDRVYSVRLGVGDRCYLARRCVGRVGGCYRSQVTILDLRGLVADVRRLDHRNRLIVYLTGVDQRP